MENPNYEYIDEFICVYSTKYRDMKECEEFVMMSNVTDHIFLQLNIFKNGNIKYQSFIPISIDVNKKMKRIEILPLVYCTYDKNKKNFKYRYIDE